MGPGDWAGLEPDVVGGGGWVGIGLVAGVEDAAGFDEEEVDFVGGEGLVLDSFGDDEHLAGVEVDGTVAEVDAEMAVEDEEGLVGVLVVVPDEVSVELD